MKADAACWSNDRLWIELRIAEELRQYYFHACTKLGAKRKRRGRGTYCPIPRVCRGQLGWHAAWKHKGGARKIYQWAEWVGYSDVPRVKLWSRRCDEPFLREGATLTEWTITTVATCRERGPRHGLIC